MNISGVQSGMQEDNLWSLWPVQGIDTVVANRYGQANNTLSLLYCDLYLRQFKETLKQTMLEQESVFEDQIHELHRLYQRQKELMMEMEGTNNLCSQTQHLLLNAGASSPQTSIHWMGSSVSVSEYSMVPPEDVSGKIDEAGVSGDECDKSGEKVLDLELPSYDCHDILEEGEEGSKNGKVHEVTNYPYDQSPRRISFEPAVQQENVQHLTYLPRFKCILDLNEPAMIEEPLDHELKQFLTPAKNRSKRAEPEAQDPLISTKSQAGEKENVIDLNMSPLFSEEKETILKRKEFEQPRDLVSDSVQGSGPSRRVLVLALPCSKTMSFFCKTSRRSLRPWKKAKRGAKSTKAREGLNLDLNVSIHEDDSHSLSTASCIPESEHNQEHLEKGSLGSLPEVKPARNMTNPGKRRRCKPRTVSGRVMKNIARTKSKTRGSFLVTEEEEQEKSAAEVIVDMSLSDSARKSSIETSDCFTPLRWFAYIASSVVEDSKSEVGLSMSEFQLDYAMDYFEAMTLQLTEITPKKQRINTSASNIVTPKQKRTPRSQGKRQQHKDCHIKRHPSLSTFSENEASQDLDKIEMLIEASETKDAQSSYNSLVENMSIDWGTITKRRRGIRSPAAKTKTPI